MILPLYNSLAPLTLNRLAVAGEAPFSPADIAGLQVWLDATTGLYDATSGGSEVTTDGSSIARWEDQSGNGYHVTQGTSNNQPVLKTAQQNSLNIVRFDGANDKLLGSTNFPVTGSSSRTVFTVFKRNNTSVAFILSWGTIGTAEFAGFTPEYYLRFQATTKGYTNQGSNGTWTIWSTVGGGSTLNDYDSYFDDGNIATPTATNNTGATLNTGSSVLAVGARPDSLFPVSGDMAEILVYDSALSDSNREAVRDYLNAKWAVY